MILIFRPLKEWVIVLTPYEKKTFYRFFYFYLSAFFLFLVTLSTLFYYMQLDQYEQVTRSKMQFIAKDVTHTIVQSHMNNQSLNLKNIATEKGFEYGLYHQNKELIFSQFKHSIPFKKSGFLTLNHNLIYIDSLVGGHLDVFYVVVKEKVLFDQIESLLFYIIIVTIALYTVISIIGWYLARQFIQPIKEQREKLDQFIKDTTHELNTPLSSLLLSMQAEDLNDTQNKIYMKMSIKKISNLYKDLTYLLLENHTKKDIPSINIASVLRNELIYFKQLAQTKQIFINANTIEDLWVKIEEDDMVRVMNNLLSNAIKYTPRQGDITIELCKNHLIIKDSGQGIKIKDQIKIFEPYHRATTVSGGFGIGLNIVYRICKAYHITIKMDSKPNKGTRFKLIF